MMSMQNQMTPSKTLEPKRAARAWVFDILLVFILIIAAAFRLAGLFWGEYQYLHPDERFLVWVGTDISPVHSLSDYFDTPNSSLNPNNRGHGFYVYGTLPMFAARYLVEWIFGRSGFNEMTQVGRALSASVDWLAVLLVFMIAKELYDKRVGLLAAAFSAGVVLQIQQSHFFTMDTFANTFALLAVYFAIRVMLSIQEPISRPDADLYNSPDLDEVRPPDDFLAPNRWLLWLKNPLFLPSLGFGIALGMAVASKLNAAPVAFILPAAMLIGYFKLAQEDRQPRAIQALVFLALAAFVSILVFRILQPYAFSGSDFFGVTPNPQWMANIREQRAQSNGNVDFPPAMQWARRPVWFSLQNMVLWGLGLPLGLLAWAGFLWAGWRMSFGSKDYPGEWRQHLLIWGWTGVYFVWQSLALNPTMRYQLPIYPTLTIFAAWAVVALYDSARKRRIKARKLFISAKWMRRIAWLVGSVVLIATYLYAYSFTTIYTRPITRIAATRWIYQNIPGPITLSIKTEQGQFNQALPFPYKLTVSPGIPYTNNFSPKTAGELTEIVLPQVIDEQASHTALDLTFTINTVPPGNAPLAQITLSDDFTPDENENGKSYTLPLEQPVVLDPSQVYNIRVEIPGEQPSLTLDGDFNLRVQPGASSPSTAPVEIPLDRREVILRPTTAAQFDFVSPVDGFLTHLWLANIASQDGISYPRLLNFTLTMPDDTGESEQAEVSVNLDPAGSGFLLALKPALALYAGQTYVIDLGMKPEGGAIHLSGAGVASEGDWDDNLPLRMDGYDGFGGIYPLDLTFNMYWEDTPDKLERFIRILNQADYITISSSRQWGSLPRIPERFPMTSLYYRELIGCPAEQEIETCYNLAQPGTYGGRLGFELVKTFQSNPGIGSFSINDQPSEEAFTVYDHPKVFIFKKTASYDSQKVSALLGSIDFSQVMRTPPMQVAPHSSNLLLPDALLGEQRAGGTWSELFNTNALYNRYPWIAALLWYLCLAILGWLVYPILRLSLPGLADKGYPLARHCRNAYSGLPGLAGWIVWYTLFSPDD